jgi:outer membrane protein
MKKSSLIINVILAVAVVALYILHFTSGNATGISSSEATSSSEIDKGGIVYINIDSVLTNYAMYEEIIEELQSKLSVREAELQSKERKLQQNFADYQNKAQKGLITRSEAAQIEQNLQVEQQQLMQLQQQMQFEMAEEEQVSQRKVLNSIMEYLSSLEAEKNYEFVLGTTFGGNVLYANDNLNITEEVIEGLNKEHTKTSEE